MGSVGVSSGAKCRPWMVKGGNELESQTISKERSGATARRGQLAVKLMPGVSTRISGPAGTGWAASSREVRAKRTTQRRIDGRFVLTGGLLDEDSNRILIRRRGRGRPGASRI